MAETKAFRLCLFLTISYIYSLKGHLCFFLRHSSGRCVRTSPNPYLSTKRVQAWYLELTDQCTDAASQLRFVNLGVLSHVSSTGCVLPLNGKPFPSDGTHLVVFHGLKDCVNNTGQAYTQTSSGALRHFSSKCVQPHTSFQSVPPVGAKLEYTRTCNTTKQNFVLGSVTCDGNRTTDINCPSSQVIVVITANYGGFGNMRTCGYNRNYNCILPSSRCQVKRRCDGLQTCKIHVRTSEFQHDPCPRMSKYLYLEYKCVNKTEFQRTNIHIRSVRLAAQTVPGQGYVEVLEDSKANTWQRLCVKSWKEEENKVVCRSLGYSGAYKPEALESMTGKANHHTIHGDMHCNGDISNVSSCCFEKITGEETCMKMARVACRICSEPMFSGRKSPVITLVASNSIPGHNPDQAAISANRSWCAIGSGDYLEIDLVQKYVISQISTLGDKSRGQWVTSYELSFTEDKNTWSHGFVDGEKILTANSDDERLATIILDTPVSARFIRIYPKTWNGRPCMRLEICGHKLLPEAPANLTLSRVTACTADVLWGKPAENGDGPSTGYLIRLFSGGTLDLINMTMNEHFYLKELKPYTEYTIIVQARNKHGYGRESKLTLKTHSSVPSGPPADIKVMAESATSLYMSWHQPQRRHRNGVLKGYQICIAHVHSHDGCDRILRTKANSVRIGNLRPATKYKIKILARNDAGFGNYSVDYFKITNAEAPLCNQSTITSQTFVVYLQKPRKEVGFCQIVVMALPQYGDVPETVLYSGKPLTYLEASDSKTPVPYVAAEFSTLEFSKYKQFTIGDGGIFAASTEIPRRSEAVKKYYNGPLSSNTKYTVIQKFYSNKELVYSSDFLPSVQTKGESLSGERKVDSSSSSDKFKIPFIFVTVILGLILSTTVCLMMLRRRRGQNQNSKQSTTPEQIPMNPTNDNNNLQTANAV